MARISEPGARAKPQRAKRAPFHPSPDSADNNATALAKRYRQPHPAQPNPDTRQPAAAARYAQSHRGQPRQNPDQQPGPSSDTRQIDKYKRNSPAYQEALGEATAMAAARRLGLGVVIKGKNAEGIGIPHYYGKGYYAKPWDVITGSKSHKELAVSGAPSGNFYTPPAIHSDAEYQDLVDALKGSPFETTVAKLKARDAKREKERYDSYHDSSPTIVEKEVGKDKQSGVSFIDPGGNKPDYSADSIIGANVSIADEGLQLSMRPLYAGFGATTELVKGHGVGKAAKEGLRGLAGKNRSTGSTLLGALGVHGPLKAIGGLALDFGAAGAMYPRGRLGSLAEDHVNAAQRAAEDASHQRTVMDSALRNNDFEEAARASKASTDAAKTSANSWRAAKEAGHHKGVAVTFGGKIPFGPRVEKEVGMKTTSTVNKAMAKLTGDKQHLRRKGVIGSSIKAFHPDYRTADFTVPQFMLTRQAESQFRARIAEGAAGGSRRNDALAGARTDVVHAIEGGPKVPFGHYVSKQVPTAAYKAEREAVAEVGKAKRHLTSLKISEARLSGAADATVPKESSAVLRKSMAIAKAVVKSGADSPAAEVLDNYRLALGARIGAAHEMVAASKAYRNAFGVDARTGAVWRGRKIVGARSLYTDEQRVAVQERWDQAVAATERAKRIYPGARKAMTDFAEAEHGHVTRLRAAQQKAIGLGRHGNPGEVAPLHIHPSLEEEYGSGIRKQINEQLSPELRRAVTAIHIRRPHAGEPDGLMGYFEPRSGEVHVLMHHGQEEIRMGGDLLDTMVHEAGHSKSIPEVYDAAKNPGTVYHLRHIARSLMDAFPAGGSHAGHDLHNWFSKPGQIGVERLYSAGDATQSAEILARLFQLHHEDPVKFLKTIGPNNARFLNAMTTDVMGLAHAKARAGALMALKRQVKLYGGFHEDELGVKFGNIERHDRYPTGRLKRLEKVRGKMQEAEGRIPGLESIAREKQAMRLAAKVGQKETKWFVKEFGPLPKGTKANAHILVPHDEALAALRDDLKHKISELPADQQHHAHMMIDRTGRMYDVEHSLGLLDKALPNYVRHTLSLAEREARSKGTTRAGVAAAFGAARHRYYGGLLTVKEINYIRRNLDPTTAKVDLLESNPRVIMAVRELEHTKATAQARFFNDIQAVVGLPWKPDMAVPEGHGVYKVTPKAITPLPTDAQREEAHAGLGAHDNMVVLPTAVYDKLIRSPRKFSEFGQGWDRLIAVIKTGQTEMNFPRHQLSNFLGDGMNAYIGGVGAQDALTATRVLKRMIERDRAERAGRPFVAHSGTVKIGGRQWNIDDFINTLRDHGIAGGGYSSGELTQEASGTASAARGISDKAIGDETSAVRTMAGKRPSLGGKTVRRIDSWREAYWRIASAIGAKRRGGTWHMAKRHVDNWHFDYQDLTDTEHALRRVVPFYTFAARNTRAQIRGLLLSPEKYAQIESTREEGAKAQGINIEKWKTGLPDYTVQNLPFPVRAKYLPRFMRGGVSGNTILSASLTGNPLTDLNRVGIPGVDNTIQTAGLNALATVAPPIRLVVEELLNHSAFFKGPIHPDASNPYLPQKAPAGSLIRNLAQIPGLAGILGYVDKYHAPDGTVRPGYDPSIDYALHGIFPQLNVALTAGLGTSSPRGQTLLQKLGGYSAINISNPQTNPLNQAYKAVGELTFKKRQLESQGLKGSKQWIQVYTALRLAERQQAILSAQRKVRPGGGAVHTKPSHEMGPIAPPAP